MVILWDSYRIEIEFGNWWHMWIVHGRDSRKRNFFFHQLLRENFEIHGIHELTMINHTHTNGRENFVEMFEFQTLQLHSKCKLVCNLTLKCTRRNTNSFTLPICRGVCYRDALYRCCKSQCGQNTHLPPRAPSLDGSKVWAQWAPMVAPGLTKWTRRTPLWWFIRLYFTDGVKFQSRGITYRWVNVQRYITIRDKNNSFRMIDSDAHILWRGFLVKKHFAW